MLEKEEKADEENCRECPVFVVYRVPAEDDHVNEEKVKQVLLFCLIIKGHAPEKLMRDCKTVANVQS